LGRELKTGSDFAGDRALLPATWIKHIPSRMSTWFESRAVHQVRLILVRGYMMIPPHKWNPRTRGCDLLMRGFWRKSRKADPPI